jgi:hypothetical protein
MIEGNSKDRLVNVIILPVYVEKSNIKLLKTAHQPHMLAVRPHFVSNVRQKRFDLVSWNYTGMLVSMFCCAPGSLRADLFRICRETALDLVKSCNLQIVWHVAKTEFVKESWNCLGMLLSMYSCAHEVSFVCFVLLFCQNYCPWLSKILQFSFLSSVALSVFTKSHET